MVNWFEQVKSSSDEAELDMWLVDQAFDMTQGYVLDFSDATFNDFIRRKFQVDVTAPMYKTEGTSKAKRLRAFLRALIPGAQADVLEALWDYRQSIVARNYPDSLEPHTRLAFLEMIDRLRGVNQTINLEIVEKFSNDPTLSELVDAIQRDIQASAPHAALDRLHTYAMKKFADLLSKRGTPTSENEALHARAGRYINGLNQAGQIGDYSAKIAKSAVSIFEQFNQVRNKQSLAHDNQLLAAAEGQYVFETVLSLLRFIKTLEGSDFGR